jgi:hypothetical protein
MSKPNISPFFASFCIKVEKLKKFFHTKKNSLINQSFKSKIITAKLRLAYFGILSLITDHFQFRILVFLFVKKSTSIISKSV